jgi:hypothetical protein
MGPLVEPMGPEIHGMAFQRHRHGPPADAVACFQHRDREPARQAAARRRDPGRSGTDDRDIHLAARMLQGRARHGLHSAKVEGLPHAGRRHSCRSGAGCGAGKPARRTHRC